jgi:hypothetical protein
LAEQLEVVIDVEGPAPPPNAERLAWQLRAMTPANEVAGSSAVSAAPTNTTRVAAIRM